tara:strand:+ start:1072 stop:1989 length:918 start_codon:yes stop_codon:yes gene_type:complete
MTEKKIKKVFLTGASGKLGSYLYYVLKKHFKILALGNKSEIGYAQKLNLLNNSILIKKLNNFNPDVIVHLAAISNVDLCEKNINLAFKSNILITSNLIKWSLKNKDVRFVYISSDQVYNKPGFNSENDRANPVNVYSLSKLSAEDLVQSLSNSVILRTNFFGYFPNKKDSLINFFLKELKKTKKIDLVKDINFNPLYVETLCLLIKKIILKKNLKGIYNLGTKNKITKGMLLYKIAKKLGCNSHIFKFVKSDKINSLSKTKRSNNMCMSVNKIEKALKFKMPKIDDEINNLNQRLLRYKKELHLD